MNVLAFDTCFAACSVAVRSAPAGREPVVQHERGLMETGHAEALMPMIERVMRQAGVAFGDLDRIVVAHGPGTFTGVRTGVAAARALALATAAKLIAVSSLWAIGLAAARHSRCSDCDAILVAMDARKGQVYAQVVDLDGRELTEPLLLDADAAAALCPQRCLLGSGTAVAAVVAAGERAGRRIATAAPAAAAGREDQPDAKVLLAAADRASVAGPLVPLYLRPPDARPQADKSLPWRPS